MNQTFTTEDNRLTIDSSEFDAVSIQKDGVELALLPLEGGTGFVTNIDPTQLAIGDDVTLIVQRPILITIADSQEVDESVDASINTSRVSLKQRGLNAIR